jgi:hypothetical protein
LLLLTHFNLGDGMARNRITTQEYGSNVAVQGLHHGGENQDPAAVAAESVTTTRRDFFRENAPFAPTDHLNTEGPKPQKMGKPSRKPSQILWHPTLCFAESRTAFPVGQICSLFAETSSAATDQRINLHGIDVARFVL